ncbi:rhomboid family intramembrane serine protease [Catellatospora methionotrophica]|uniref:Rhomboid family intramembrane serine protease n=1 Tax=Catellatospora methionotrophica TaxID=121620 RepID=A0A8J3LGW0_9ACTN|nr:rhomboid family intramembrane serine protease [Catellatospora methionotrophica]
MTSPAPQGGLPPIPSCYRHPGRETHLKCSRCEKPICPDCMIPASVGHHCPGCVAEGRRTQRPALTHFGGSQAGMHGYVTKALIGVNVAVFLLGLVLVGARAAFDGGLFTGATDIQFLGGVTGPSFCSDDGTGHCLQVYTGIDDGAYYRMFTAMFIHYGILHLALNMWALWVLGRSLEAALGPIRFLALYLLCGFGGNVACYVLSPDALSAGASTAIYGLFAAYFFVLKRLGRDAMSVIPIIAINVLLSFSIDGISWQGHLGGLVTGAVCGLGLAYAPRENRTLVQGGVLGAVFLALVAVTVGISLAG